MTISNVTAINAIGTNEAAYLLGICHQRVRQLLVNGRIKGAKKVGRFWQIPLYKGMPKIIPGKRGPKGTWKKQLQRTASYIHVNQQILKKNLTNKTREPVITVKRGLKNTYCHEVEIFGPSRLIYRPNEQKSCGATLWLEIEPNIEIITKVFASN
jgi:hypothetical protein